MKRTGINQVVLWSIQLASLVAIPVWVLLDPAFDRFLQSQVWSFEAGIQWQLLVLGLLLVLFIVIWCGLLVANLWGPRQYRRLWSLLALATVATVGFGVVKTLPQVAFKGKGLRMRGEVHLLEQIAVDLRQQWPRDDGEHPQLGPFMAYPAGSPSALVLLTPPVVTDDGLAISLVERTGSQGLRFELAEGMRRDWIEWHPPGEQPMSNVGGLMDVYELQRSTPLGDGWYLVRYRAS